MSTRIKGIGKEPLGYLFSDEVIEEIREGRAASLIARTLGLQNYTVARSILKNDEYIKAYIAYIVMQKVDCKEAIEIKDIIGYCEPLYLILKSWHRKGILKDRE